MPRPYAFAQDAVLRWGSAALRLRCQSLAQAGDHDVHAEGARTALLEFAHVGADAAADIQHDLARERGEGTNHLKAAILAEAPDETGIAARDGGFVVHQLILSRKFDGNQ